MNNNQPIYILPEGATRQLGRDAQRNNIMAAKIVAETVRSTLGPKGWSYNSRRNENRTSSC